MGGFPISRFFRLNVGGLHCDERGLFIGGAPLLERSSRSGGREGWTPRPATALNRDLAACYGLPVDASAKHRGLTVVARALGRNDLALAQIAALLLQFPDPPSLTKDSSAQGAAALARQLIECRPAEGGLGRGGTSAHRRAAQSRLVRPEGRRRRPSRRKRRRDASDDDGCAIEADPGRAGGKRGRPARAKSESLPSPASPPEPEPNAEAEPEQPSTAREVTWRGHAILQGASQGRKCFPTIERWRSYFALGQARRFEKRSPTQSRI